MSLHPCPECKANISDKASSCPHCGAPAQAPKAPSGPTLRHQPKWVYYGIAFLALLALGPLFGPPSKNPGTATGGCAADNLQCLGERGIVAAGVYCKGEIEAFAKHSVRWTDGTLDTKFTHFRWRNKAAGEITYMGGKAEFQNGFGAFTPVVYECDMARDNKTILDVRVREGRLQD